MISMICALGRNRAIGRKDGLLWRIPDDLKRFKVITMGHAIIMGRKTYETIRRPLPGRTSIIVTRNTGYKAEGCIVCASIDEAVAAARQKHGADDEVFIIGGGQIYEQALHLASRLYLTLVDDSPENADTFFPQYPGFRTVSEEGGGAEPVPYRFVTMER